MMSAFSLGRWTDPELSLRTTWLRRVTGLECFRTVTHPLNDHVLPKVFDVVPDNMVVLE